MAIYIRSIATISHHTHPATSPFANAMVCADPDLNGAIDPKLTRRMSHVIKMGIGAAMEALKQAGNPQPDAIITGTAYGCLDDTGVFLKKQVQQKETMLTPTAFIQSTHNTVGGQIGLMLHCNAYNNTFVHRGFSFEHALEDAIMLLDEQNAENVLVGAVDELTNTSHILLSRFGLYKNISKEQPGLLPAKGTIAGEGAAFFVLSNKQHAGNYGVIKGIATFYKPTIDGIKEHVNAFLAGHSRNTTSIDLIIAGYNGDTPSDKIYDEVLALFGEIPVVTFKDESGEYPTATGFALWKAATILREAQTSGNPSPKNILIYNHYQNIHHTLQLLTAC